MIGFEINQLIFCSSVGGREVGSPQEGSELSSQQVALTGILGPMDTAPASTSLNWEPPHLPFLKCNCDAAIFNEGKSISYGLVVRNSVGVFICAKSDILPTQCSILMAEALSVREALTWLKGYGYSHVVVETDNKVFFESLVSQEERFSYAASIVDDCRLFSRQFVSCNFSWVSRSDNVVAHTLARSILKSIFNNF